MRIERKLLTLMTIVVSTSISANVQGQDNLVNATEIIVFGSKMTRPISEMNQSISVIDAEEIESLGYGNLTEILRNESGIEFKQSGAAGQFNTFNIRGFASGHVLVLLDGIKMNSGSTGSVGNIIGQINPDNIARIEILRGPQASLYGSNSSAGVISIVTKNNANIINENNSIEKAEDFSVSIESGSMDWRSFSINHLNSVSFSSGNTLNYSLNYNNRESDGIHKYEYSENENFGANINYQANSVLLGASYWKTDNKFSFAELDEQFLSVSDRSQHWAFQTPDPHQSLATDNDVFMVFAEQTLSAQWKHKVTIGFEQKSEHYSDLNDGLLGEVIAPYDNFTDFSCDYFTQYSQGELVPVCDDGSQRKIKNKNKQVDYNLNFNGNNFNVLFGAEYLQQKSESSGYKKNQQAKSVYGHSGMSIWNGRGNVSLGLRLDKYDSWGSDSSVSAGIGFDLNDYVNIFANYGESFTTPTSDDLFGIYGGNLNLEPESGKTYELGLRAVLNTATFTINFWHAEITNVITYDGSILNVNNPFGYGLYINSDSQKTKGMELDFSYQFTQSLQLNANYTYTDSQTANEFERKRTVQVADNKANVGILYEQNKFSLGAHVYYLGPRLRWAGDVEMKAYTRVDIFGNYQVNDKVRVFTRIENLFDREIEEGLGYLQPGLYGRIGLEYKL